jgi:hypothetical protein
MKEFNRVTKFQHLCFDRGPMSYAVYGEMNSDDRKPLTSYVHINKIMGSSISVYLFNSDTEAIAKRCCKTCHTDFDILEHTNYFEECINCLKDSKHTVIEIECQNLSVPEIVERILNELEKLQ